jgi:hypothetical protein
MNFKIARTVMGDCAGCGLRIEEGEYFASQDGLLVHHGCSSKGSMTGAAPQVGMFLFDDTQLAAIEKAKEVVGVNQVSFDGATVLGIDSPRLAGQLAKVYELMKDGQYRTLAQIASAAGCLETSASARLRDLRKARFGNHAVESRRVEGTTALYEYRLIISQVRERDHERHAA